jgi:hypothetical protein
MQRFKAILWVLVLLSFLPGAGALAQQSTPASVAIHAPQAGQALKGIVPIVVSNAVEDFQSVELSFAYANDTTGTWFLIFEGDQPVDNATIAQWDTTTITDGEYNLRMVVNLLNGSQQTVTVAGLRVRNYSAAETDTPAPVTPTASSTPTNGGAPMIEGEPTTSTPEATSTIMQPTPTQTSPPLTVTVTPIPPNPAQISGEQVLLSMGVGVLVVAGVFALLGAYHWLRSLARKRYEE